MKSITGAILTLAGVVAFTNTVRYEALGLCLFGVASLYFLSDWIGGLRKKIPADWPLSRLFGLDE